MKNTTLAILFSTAIGILFFFGCKASAQTTIGDTLSHLGDQITGTNAAFVAFGGKSLSKSDTYCAGGLYSFAITDQGGASVVGGVDRLFTTGGSGIGKSSDTFTLSGGFQLSALIHPFSMWGATNFAVRTGAATLIGTPTSGQNNGNIMNLNRVFIYTDLVSFKLPKFNVPAAVSLGAAYGNRTGAGSQFDGNWADVLLAVHSGDGGLSMMSASLEDQKIAETMNQRL